MEETLFEVLTEAFRSFRIRRLLGTGTGPIRFHERREMTEPQSLRRSSGGEFEILPSGRRIEIRLWADPWRPWGVRGSATAFEVYRQRRGDSSAVEVYAAGRVLPIVLTEADAKALAALLNARLKPRKRRPGEMP